MDLRLLDVDLRFDLLAHRMDGQIQPVATPLLVDVAGTSRNMIPELVEIAGDPPSCFLSTKLMRQVDVDWSLHG